MEKKPVKRKRPSFWRSYSYVLTLVVVTSVLIISAFAIDYRFNNGILQKFVGSNIGASGWENANFKTQAEFQRFAENVGIASSGGITLAELNSSLENYIGERLASYVFPDGTGAGINVSVKDVYDAIAKNALYSTMPLYDRRASTPTLGNNGVVTSTGPASVTELIRDGFAGLSKNLMENPYATYSFDLVSGRSKYVKGSSLVPFLAGVISVISDNQGSIYKRQLEIVRAEENVRLALIGDPNSSYTTTLWNSSTGEEQYVIYRDILSAITGLGASIQNDLAKLRYVLASDKDIEMAEKQEPIKDAISDKFTGDSPAAINPDDVGDMAGISGNLQDAFHTGANAGDALGALTGSDNWNFWSQETADDLNRVPASVAEDEEEDFIHFYDPSALDEYLAGGDKS